MHAQRVVGTVGDNGFVQFNTDQPKGTRVEIIVLALDENMPVEVENTWNSLNAFEAASLDAFFEGDDDKNVDWLEVFDVKDR